MKYSESRDGQGSDPLPAADQDQGLEAPDMAPQKRTTAPAFQFYPADFLSDDKVCRMDYEELGVYWVLLSHAWLANGLPTELPAIAKMLKLKPARFKALWAGPVSECFVEKHGRLINPRQEKERKKQREYRDRQKDAAASRWDRSRHTQEDAKAMPKERSGNALQSSSSVSNLHTSVETHRPGAPIHTTHKGHASCGRVCVPAFLHTEFVSSLNRDTADADMRAFYSDINREWTDGARKDDLPGEALAFWRARFHERWPATTVTKPKGVYSGWKPRESAS